MNATGPAPRPQHPPAEPAAAVTGDTDDTEAHPDIGSGDTDVSGTLSGPETAPGTMSMARRLLDPATEAEIQALAAEAGPMTEDQRATLARLLRLRRPRPRNPTNHPRE